MARKKIHLEYVLEGTTKGIVWDAISTPTGLEEWFADRVESDDKLITFHWGKTEQRQAEIIAIRAFSYIKFRWLDSEYDKDIFELRMIEDELTNDLILEVKETAEPDEVDDHEELWESQIETLRRIKGF